MIQRDFKYLNVPGLLSRKSLVVTDGAGFAEDTSWSTTMSELIFVLIQFFKDNCLLDKDIGDDVENLVLMYSDFNDEGRRFVMSGAPDKWLQSFDRNLAKSALDTSYLNKRLKSVRLKN